MKKLRDVLLLALVLGTGGPVLYYGGLLSLYGLSVLFARDTAFAPGFSEEKFEQVRKGMRRTEVEALIGTGHWTSPDRSVVGYSYSPTGTHFDQRKVVYRDDRVIDVVAEVYFD